MDEIPDLPLDNFGAETEVATPPVANEPEAPAEGTEQTTQEEPQADGSEVQPEAQPETTPDNPSAEEQPSGRPEKRDRVQSRINELTARNKQAEALIEDLNLKLAQNQAIAGIQRPQPDENGEIDVNKLLEYNQQVAQASAAASATAQVRSLEQRLERESIANRLDSEGAQIETKYKDYFDADPSLLEDIAAEVEDRIKLANGNLGAMREISATKIAERYMRGITAVQRRAQTVTAQNLQTTQAQAGVVPESAPTPEDPNSDEALEARVANIKF